MKNSTLRVLHLFNEIQFSGAEIMYAKSASIFQNHNMELTAFSTGKTMGSYRDTFESKGIRCKHFPIPNRLSILKIIKYNISLYHYLKLHGIDVLHIHRSDLFTPGIIAYLLGIRCIKTQHSTFKNRWFTLPYGILQRIIARYIFGVIFHTIGDSVYTNELHYYRNPSTKINNWYDDTQYFPGNGNEKSNARHSLNIPPEAFVIISIGSCNHGKNHHDILRAISNIPNPNNIIYIHLGTGSTEAEEIELSNRLNLQPKVKFYGNVTNVREYLIASDLFVMPSHFEGLSIASIEAMACGIPSILYDVPGLRDLIHNNDNGLLISESSDKLTEAIIYLQSNHTVATSMATNAHAFATNHFNMSNCVRQIIQLYHAYNGNNKII